MEQRQKAKTLLNGYDFSPQEKVDVLYEMWEERYSKSDIKGLGMETVNDIYDSLMDLDKYFDLERNPQSYLHNNNAQNKNKSLV